MYEGNIKVQSPVEKIVEISRIVFEKSRVQNLWKRKIIKICSQFSDAG